MSEATSHTTLVLGIGNSSRQDDALGWEFLDFLKTSEIAGLDLEYRYQLQIEDAELIAHYKRVIFVDATTEGIESGFYIKPCEAAIMEPLNSHSLRPETVAYLCRNLFEANPECLILGIEGKQWELGKGMSEKARSNLSSAQNYFIEHLFVYL